MRESESISEFFDPQEVVMRHPLPLLRRWLARTASEQQEAIEKKIACFICPECGFMAFFKREVG